MSDAGGPVGACHRAWRQTAHLTHRLNMQLGLLFLTLSDSLRGIIGQPSIVIRQMCDSNTEYNTDNMKNTVNQGLRGSLLYMSTSYPVQSYDTHNILTSMSGACCHGDLQSKAEKGARCKELGES